MGAEVSTAKYQLDNQTVQLVLISYPTPQMARKYEIVLQDPRRLTDFSGAPVKIFSKRSGPLVALVLNAANENQAEQLLKTVQYTANFTWNQPLPEEEIAAYMRTIVRGIMLTMALLLFTLGAGIVLGLLRLGAKLWLPFHIFDRPEDVEMIQLHLGGKVQPRTKS